MTSLPPNPGNDVIAAGSVDGVGAGRSGTRSRLAVAGFPRPRAVAGSDSMMSVTANTNTRIERRFMNNPLLPEHRD